MHWKKQARQHQERLQQPACLVAISVLISFFFFFPSPGRRKAEVCFFLAFQSSIFRSLPFRSTTFFGTATGTIAMADVTGPESLCLGRFYARFMGVRGGMAFDFGHSTILPPIPHPYRGTMFGIKCVLISFPSTG